MMPYNEDAEKAVLGAILLNAKCLQTAMEHVSPSDFYHKGHRILFSEFIAYSNSEQVNTLNLVSIVAFLKSRGRLDSCGGMSYISSLSGNVSNTASVDVYSRIIHALALRRQFIQLANEFSIAGYDESREIVRLIDESETKLSRLAQGTADINRDVSIRNYASQALCKLRDKMEGKCSENLETGIDRLDQMTDGGFHPTDFIIIAARPSIGKTAFATSIVQNMICAPRNYSVAYFSLEMSGMQVSQRLISGISTVPLKMIRRADFANQRDPGFSRVMGAFQRLFETKLFILDTPNMKLSEIRTTARRLRREQHIQAIFIDYIGLIDAEMPAASKKFEQVSEISKSLKSLARELEIPVVVLCQVTRDAEGDKNEPQLNNLRDSGAIEQDADMVMFLHCSRKIEQDKLVKDQKGEITLQPTKVIVAKQRNGETGEFFVGFKPNTASFEPLADGTWKI